jgi:hypothetical protein
MSTLKINEALVSWVALYALSFKNRCSFTKLTVILSMAVDEEMSKIVSHNYGHLDNGRILELLVKAAFNRCYLDILPVNINAIVLLCQSKLIHNNKGILTLTETGHNALMDISNINSERLKFIMESMLNVIELTFDIEDVELYKNLRITL